MLDPRLRNSGVTDMEESSELRLEMLHGTIWRWARPMAGLSLINHRKVQNSIYGRDKTSRHKTRR